MSEERDAERLAGTVRLLRRRLSLSQVQLAQQAGLSRSTIARIELGLANPDLATLSKLATALDVSTSRLLKA